jgi:hypothetical protein
MIERDQAIGWGIAPNTGVRGLWVWLGANADNVSRCATNSAGFNKWMAICAVHLA